MKKWLRSSISLLLAVVMIVSNAAFVRAETADDGVDLSDGLLAHYDFENVSGTSVPNTADAAAHTGTLSGSATVVDLEGVSQPGKAMRLGSAAGGMQLTGILDASSSSFSVSLWYKASATSGSNVNLVQAGTMGGSTGRTILILDPNSKYQTYLTGDNAKTPTNTTVTPTAWQHITFVYDLANSKAYFYINGVADRADGLSLSGTPMSVSDMIIGRHRNDNEGQFNGLIDEVRVYSKVLSAAEAAAIYEQTQSAFSVPPVGDITLTVDAGSIERIIDSDSIFGINHRYAFNGYGSFDSTTMEIKEDFLKLYEEAGFGSIRYPGGTISNLFNWKTTIGPVEQRKNQIHGFYNYTGQGGIAPNFGLDEIGAFAESVDSEIVYVYSLGRGNAQDAADLIEYLNAKVGTNPNGGIDWAAVRAANGHEAPYNVRYFEIGNEMQQAWAGSDGVGSQGYWTTSVAAGSETAYIAGGTATFTMQYAVCEEDWNATASLSDGSANLVRYMRYANVNPKKYDENGNIVDDPDFKAVNDGVSVYVGSTQWTVVDSFENSGASDRHVVIDYSTGAIKFGDGVNGAIPASGQQIYVSYSVERDGFIHIAQAIKDTTAAINQAEGTGYEANVYSSYETQGFITQMANRNANDLYDGLTIHPYSGTPSGSGGTFYDSAMSLAESAGIQKVQSYVDMMPEGKVPVISEYGIFRSTDTLVRSQTHAIYIAKVLMEYVRLGSPYIQKHCLVDWYSSGADSLGPTQQAVIQAVAGSDANTTTGEGTFTFFSTPSAHVFRMLNAAFGDEVISTQFSATPTMSNGAATLSALASKDAFGTVYVAIVNASREEDYELTLNLENMDLTGATVTAQILTADSYDAQNSPDDPDNVTVVTQEVTFDPDDFTYTVPKHTFVILTIDPADTVQTRQVTVNAGETVTVTDNSGNYENAVDKSELDASIAEVSVVGTTTAASKTLGGEVTAIESGKRYILVSDRAGKPMTNGAASVVAGAGAMTGLSLEGAAADLADNAIWTITESNGAYTVQDAAGKYLVIALNAVSLSDTEATVNITYNTTGAYWTLNVGDAYLNDAGAAGTCASGYNAPTGFGSQWSICEVSETPASSSTAITFTGMKAGQTAVRVGMTRYEITVNEHVHADGDGDYRCDFCDGVFVHESSFPDANFRSFILSQTYGEDAFLTVEELVQVTVLDVSEKEIQDLTGVEFFSALYWLNCSENRLTSLDVSRNTELMALYCSYNQLTSLDVTNNTALVELCCEFNQLTSLDVSKNTALENLSCGGNQLTNLDVSKNVALHWLWCDNNQLTSLDVTQHTALVELNCGVNQLISLDVSQNAALKGLRCGGNQLTNLDVSKNTALKVLTCGTNQLTSLDVTNNTALVELSCEFNQLTSLDVSKNTALWYLCCDSNQLTNLDVSNNTELGYLFCDNNQLTSLDMSSNTILRDVVCNNNSYTITVDIDNQFDLSALPGSFDVTRASNWTGGTVSGNILTAESETITYSYQVSENRMRTFTLRCCVHIKGDIQIENEVKATCTTAGSYDEVVYCTGCGEELSRKTKTVEKLAHTSDEAVIEKEVKATCEKGGSYEEVVYCDLCGEELSRKTVTVDALGHKDEDKDHKCDVCEEVISECADENKDHSCDTCEKVLSECEDKDGDNKCDACGKDMGTEPSEPIEEDSVIRLAGAHRWETAIKVADEMKANLGVEKFDTIIIASGNDFADALAGSYLSTVKSAPILLSWGQGGKYEYLDTDNIEYIKENLAEGGTVYILGGEKAVPASYEEALKDYNVERLGGANRFETNLLILEEAGVNKGDEILVCTSTNFADSLSASAIGKPILLVFNNYKALYGEQPEYLATLEDCTFTIVGGESAVCAELETAIKTYGETTRLAGENRFETSVMVAEKYFENPETAVLAYAWNYPDGLCGGALAYSMDAPLVLTMTKYEAEAVAYATENTITSGVVLGGDGLISDEAVRSVFAMDPEAEIIVK